MLSSRFFSRCFATSVRFAQRPPRPPIDRISTNKLLWKMLENRNIQSPQDWKNVRFEILSSEIVFTTGNIDAMTVDVCTKQKKFDWALSYLEFLKSENVDLNLATIGKYFKLLYVKGMDECLSTADEDSILTMYDTLRKSHPILDSLTLDSVVQALSLTKRWKLCVELLDEIKVASSVSANAYSAVVAAAFSNNADSLAWKLLDEMLAKNKTILENVYISYFKKISKESDRRKGIETMFKFMQQNSIRLDSVIVKDFVDSLLSLNLCIRSSSVGHRGTCKGCDNKLKIFDLTESEFNDLKSNIVQNVIVGKDVFNKTTADELARFRDFISNMEKFDVIVDGLNVAYSAGTGQSPLVMSGLVHNTTGLSAFFFSILFFAQLSAVVSHFVHNGKKVLVLGRNHMNKWPRQNWGYITQNATTFLTENLSQDDPYLLYCALQSGQDTIVITRDLMRGHKFLLNEVRLKLLFERWLAQRQYLLVRVQDRGTPTFKKPFPFSHIAQKSGGCWHIPCMSDSGAPSSNTNWLCVKM